MKKILVTILTLCMCFTLGVSLTACDFLFQEPEHTHAYTKTIATEDYLKSEATCLSKAEYYKSCECGEKGTESFESGELSPCVYENGKCKWCEEDEPIIHTHTYDKQVAESKYLKEEANCKTKAVYWLSCECGDKGTNTFEYGSMLSHTYDKQVAENRYLKEEATCISKAVYWLSCECGEKGSDTFEYGDFAEHDFSLTWTKENGKHWYACQTEGCLVKSNEEVHSYINGECVCGELEPVVDINEVSLTQWESAFEFENVTINQYLVISQGQYISVGTYLIDDSNAAMSFEGNTIPMEGYADFIRMNFDFSNCYTFAEYQDGKYFIDSFDVYGDGSYVYEDAYLTFENGVLKSITTTIKEEVPEYDDDYNEIGSTVETSSCFIEFVDYGTTTITIVENTLPITQEEWEALFATENYNNMTIVASFSVGNTAYVENIYYNNGNEKITVTRYNNVELYYVNSTWYTYAVSENMFVETDVFGAEYPYVTLSDSFKNFFSMMKNLYALINYDATEDTYYYISDSASYYITVNNGKVASLSTILNIEGEASVYSYTISNYGTTSFVIPFDPTHVCNYMEEVVDDKYWKSDATCTAPAVYFKSCECGKKGTTTFYYGEALGCNFGDWESIGGGKHFQTCLRDATHVVTEDCFGGTATCEYLAVCDVCETEYGNKANHTWDDDCVFCTICSEAGLIFALSNDEASYSVIGIVESFTGNNIKIPGTYLDLPVISIGENAFKNYLCVTSITIPESIENIGQKAFYNCSSLVDVYFNAINCKDLKNTSDVFYNNNKIKNSLNVTFGENVKVVPAYLFYTQTKNNCPNIESVVFKENNTCEKIGDYAFGNCLGLTSIKIPNSVTEIGNYSFYYCSNLIDFIMPTSIESIGKYAFGYCAGLTSIEISSSVANIGQNSFYGCAGLTEIYYNAVTCDDLTSSSNAFVTAGKDSDGINVIIGKDVQQIPEYLFYNADYVKTITFTEDSVCKNIGRSSFYGCAGLTEIYYNAVNCDDLTSSSNAFKDAGENGLGIKVTIGAKVKKIPNYLFYYSSNITSVEFKENSVCESIGSGSFYNCNSLTDINIPNSVTNIGASAFRDCNALTSIYIPIGVTKISDYTFYNCTALTEIIYNATECSNLNYKNYVFYNAGKDDLGIKVTIGANVKKIPSYLFCFDASSTSPSHFEYSPKITSVEFEEGSICERIGEYAFAFCMDLLKITIPDSIKNISAWAFSNTTNLTQIIYNATECDDIDAESYTFANAGHRDKKVELIIGNNVKKIPNNLFSTSNISILTFENDSICESIGNNAFSSCLCLTSITIPNNITTIGKTAFFGCYNLIEIIYNATDCSSLGKDNQVFDYAGKNGSGIKVTIGKDVKTIPSYLFYYGTLNSLTSPPKITSVEFKEDSVCESIGFASFYNCDLLTGITIPHTVKSIEGSAFANCDSLKNMVIPNSVTAIGDYAFTKCSKLTNIDFEENSKLLSFGNYVFQDCTLLTNIVLGMNIKSIGCDAFDNTGYYNKTDNWVENVLYIGKYLIAANTKISGSYNIKEGTLVIGEEAFSACKSLENITIPKSVTSIGDEAFSGCNKLTNIEFVENSNLTSIGNYSFEYCSLLTNLNIPNSVTSIGDFAFKYCSGLTNITIPDSIESLGYGAFEGCNKLQFTRENYCAYLGNSNNPYLLLVKTTWADIKNIIINENCRIIGSAAFDDCTSLTSIKIPSSIKSIGAYAFRGCTSLTSIEIPNSVTSIGENAFYGCISLSEIKIPNGVMCINDYVFQSCRSLKNIKIPNSITSIGNYSFYYCTALTTIEIPNSVTSIGSQAFYNCSELKEITFCGTKSEWDEISKVSNWKSNDLTLYCTDGSYTI